MPIDTSNLSNEAYEAVLIEAEKLTHDLTLHFGLLSYRAKDEADYLNKAKILARQIKKMDAKDVEDFLFGSKISLTKLHATLDKIISNIDRVIQIPEEKRYYEFGR